MGFLWFIPHKMNANACITYVWGKNNKFMISFYYICFLFVKIKYQFYFFGNFLKCLSVTQNVLQKSRMMMAGLDICH